MANTNIHEYNGIVYTLDLKLNAVKPVVRRLSNLERTNYNSVVRVFNQACLKARAGDADGAELLFGSADRMIESLGAKLGLWVSA